MDLLSYPDLHCEHDFSVASVLTVNTGKATFIQSKHQRLQVTAQAEHIGYLQKGDKVIALCLPESIIIVARIVDVKHSPAVLLRQYDEDTIGCRFGDSELRMSKLGDITIKNKSAELSITSEGEYNIAPTHFCVTSVHDITIKTFSGSINCFYPES